MSSTSQFACVLLMLLAGLLAWSWERIARPAAAAAVAVTAERMTVTDHPMITPARMEEVWREFPDLEAARLADGRRFIHVGLARTARLAIGDAFAVPSGDGAPAGSAVVLDVHDEGEVRVIGGYIVGAGHASDHFELRLAAHLGELEGVLVVAGATYQLFTRHGLGWISAPPG